MTWGCSCSLQMQMAKKRKMQVVDIKISSDKGPIEGLRVLRKWRGNERYKPPAARTLQGPTWGSSCSLKTVKEREMQAASSKILSRAYLRVFMLFANGEEKRDASRQQQDLHKEVVELLKDQLPVGFADFRGQFVGTVFGWQEEFCCILSWSMIKG